MSMLGGPVIALTQAAFDKLPEYSATVPTGGTPGKQWKSNNGWCHTDKDDWYLEEYYEKPGDTEYVYVKRARIVIREVGLKASEVVGSDEWARLRDEFWAQIKKEAATCKDSDNGKDVVAAASRSRPAGRSVVSVRS